MSNAAERKIKEALELAANHKRNGDHPTEAVIKAASACGLNPDMTERLVEGFNIALTNATLKRASDKTASFPVAIIADVIKGVFDTHQAVDDGSRKSASSDGTESFSVQSGDIDLSWMSGIPRGHKKAASLDVPEFMVRQALGVIDENRHLMSKFAQDYFDASNRLEAAFNTIVDLCDRSENIGKFAAFEMQALSEYGPEIKPVLDNIFEGTCLGEHGCRRFDGEAKIASMYFPETEIYKRFEELMSATEKFHRSEAEYESKRASLEKENEDLVRLMGEAIPGTLPLNDRRKEGAASMVGATGSPFFSKEGAGGPPGRDSEPRGGGGKGFSIKPMQSPFDRSSRLVPSSYSGAASGITDQYSEAYTKGLEHFYKGDKDETDRDIDNIKRETILREVMANDEIVSRANPKDVEKSYNALLSIAPDLTLQPAVVAGWLRQSASTQSVDPFTANQLAELQGAVTKNKMMAKGQLRPITG